MKKFFKFLAGLLAFVGVVGGILYFLKNFLMKDYLEDYDDDDFDNDLYDAEDDRDYVTLSPESSDVDSSDPDGEESDDESLIKDEEELVPED